MIQNNLIHNAFRLWKTITFRRWEEQPPSFQLYTSLEVLLIDYTSTEVSCQVYLLWFLLLLASKATSKQALVAAKTLELSSNHGTTWNQQQLKLSIGTS
jgi:hypothetical protein